ncbi:MAG: hypothetical protein WB611_28335 [Stellaceae bacterium]
MPILEITAESLGDPLTQAYVTAVMLWPKDAKQRAEFMRSARAEFLTRNVREVTADELDRLFEMAREAMPGRVLAPKIDAVFTRGFQAGELLATAVLTRVKLESLKTRMVEPSRRKAHRALDFSRTTLETAVWRDFKTVAPYWAATVHLSFDNPCPAGDFLYFLSVADFFARAAIAIRSDRRSEPLLIETDLWQLPPGLPLHRVELRRAD